MEIVIQRHKTARTVIYFLIILIVLAAITGLVWKFESSKSEQVRLTATIESLRLARCQEIVFSKGICNVKAEMSYREKILGFSLPTFALGSKSVSYDGPVVMRFGYDSTIPLFPEGTKFVSDGNWFSPHYTITIPAFQNPKVLSDPSMKGYSKQSESLLTGDISAAVFHGYVDSLVGIAGLHAVEANPNYFRTEYLRMVGNLLSPLFGKNADLKIVLQGEAYQMNDLENLGNPEQKFVENISGLKNL